MANEQYTKPVAIVCEAATPAGLQTAINAAVTTALSAAKSNYPVQALAPTIQVGSIASVWNSTTLSYSAVVTYLTLVDAAE